MKKYQQYRLINQPQLVKVILLTMLLSVLALLLTGCGGDKTSERTKHISKSKEPIKIAVVWPKRTGLRDLYKGAYLAADQINRQGGIKKRVIKIVEVEGYDNVTKGMRSAQEIANNRDILAVIGHYRSYVSFPASVTYQSNGVLMINPGSTNNQLTKQGYKLVFRIIPNNKVMGNALAEYVKKKGYKNIIIYYVNNDYGRQLANAFEKKVTSYGVHVVTRRSFEKGRKLFGPLMRAWSQLHNFDSLFIAADPTETALIVKQARKAGITAPVLGGHRIDSRHFIELAGKASEGIIFFSTFHHNDPSVAAQKFVREYQAQYHEEPNVWAALGYDSVMILADGIKKSKSLDARKIASAITKLRGAPGAAGPYSFDKTGESINVDLTKKVIKDGRFRRVDRVKKQPQW